MLFLAAAAVLGGVILVALGRGGEMAGFPADYPPFVLDRATAADVALLQPPRSLWGYNAQITDEALQVIAQAVSDRDVEIERLRGQLAQLRYAAPSAPAPAAAKEPPAGTAPAGTAPGGDAPAGTAPGGDAPAGTAPGGDAPAGTAPGGDAPAGTAPGGDTPTGTVSAGTAPVAPAEHGGDD